MKINRRDKKLDSLIGKKVIIEFDDDVTIELHGDKPDLQAGLKEMGSFFLEE